MGTTQHALTNRTIPLMHQLYAATLLISIKHAQKKAYQLRGTPFLKNQCDCLGNNSFNAF